MSLFRILAAVFLLLTLTACASEETPVTGIGDANSSVPATDPISGTWSGDWGVTPSQRNLITLALNWDGTTLGGSVDPGPNAVGITKGTFVPDTGALTLEASGNGLDGKVIQYTAEGRLHEGSISGTITQDGKKGDFKLIRK